MTTLETLQTQKEKAMEERHIAVAPYDARIKQLNAAIRAIQSFQAETNKINSRSTEHVSELDDETER